MTDREKAIVMAFTGICMLKGDKLGEYYKYCSEKLGYSAQTFEIYTEKMKQLAKDDFIELCRSEGNNAENIVRCKECKHRPRKVADEGNGFDYKYPDSVCIAQCQYDPWYNWMPPDEFYCAYGEKDERHEE